MEKLKRYLIFLVGLFVNSLGVSLITKANLGTSPISSIPYVLSLNFPFTLGNFTIFFSILLIILQLIILRKNFKLEHILQIPVSIIFGYFIDLTMILFSWVNPEVYINENRISAHRVYDPWRRRLIWRSWRTLSCFRENPLSVPLLSHGKQTSEQPRSVLMYPWQ